MPGPDRLPHMADVIKKTNPDIFGTQEGKFNQLKELNAKIPGLHLVWNRS